MEEDYQEPRHTRSERHKSASRREKNADQPPKASKPEKKKSNVKVRPIFAAIILIVLMFLGAVAGYALSNNTQKPVDISTLPEDQQQAAKDERALENINVLLVGCDQRENEIARADTIILAILRPVDKEVSLLSIPRDTYVKIKGNGTTKINHALVYGGMPLLKDTVENFLDVKIDHTAQINFDGFKNVIDALGGVTIDVERRMYKPLEDIDLKPGLQKLNGYDALAYVRWREPIVADLGRIERQQKFIAAMVEGIKGMGLKDALSVGGAVMDSIDTDMSVTMMTKYGTKFLGITPSDIETYSMNGESVTIDGVNYLKVDQKTVTDTMKLMKYGNPEPENAPAGADSANTDQSTSTKTSSK